MTHEIVMKHFIWDLYQCRNMHANFYELLMHRKIIIQLLVIKSYINYYTNHKFENYDFIKLK